MMAAKTTHSGAPPRTTHHHEDEDEDDVINNEMMLYHNLSISNWSAALKSLHESPLSASIWIINRHGRMLPLHAAILYGAPSHVTMKILNAYPNAAREKDLQGRLPLHIAASVAAIVAVNGEQVVNELVRVYPEALWTSDDSGRTAMELVEILQQMQNNEEEGRQKRLEEPSLKSGDDFENDLEAQSHEQRQYQQQLELHTSKLAKQSQLLQQHKQQQPQQQQDDYKSIYDLLSQGIAPITLPYTVSTESACTPVIKNNSKVLARKEGNSDNQDSVDRDKPLAKITFIATAPEQEEEDSVVSPDRDNALYRCDDGMSYDEIEYGLSGSLDKDEEDVMIAKHLSPCNEATRNLNSAANTMKETEEKGSNAKRPLSNLGTKMRIKRRKKGSLMDLVSTVGSSMSFDGIVASYSKGKESKVPRPTRCDCYMCNAAAEITQEMDDIKGALLAFDLVMPTLLLDYLVASHWDNVMSRVREAPSEVKAWARKEVDGEVVCDVLPLHAAIVLGAPSDVIIALLNAYPSGAGEIDGNRSFPIHLAASCLPYIERGDRVVGHLLKAFRSGKHAVDAKGRTPSDIVSIMSTSRDHIKDYTRRESKLDLVSQKCSESNITLTQTFEEDAAFAYLVEKAMTNLNMSLKYQHSFLRQASTKGIETIDDLLMADDDFLDTLFSEKELTVELRRLLSLFIEGRG
eukprot:scaffold8640_cov135-Skeletonema_marinoi.AAC.3